MVNFKDIEKANSTIKTMQISRWDKKSGKNIVKDYAEVNQRIKAFRMLFPEGFIRTDIVSHENDIVIIRAVVGYHNEQGVEIILGTGTAFEDKKNGMINGTSYIENCETSAVGRALGMLALGVDVSAASYEEVRNAMAQQSVPASPKKTTKKSAVESYTCEVCGQTVTDIGDMKASGIAKKSYHDYGKIMCYNCAHAEKERREQAAAAVDVEKLAEDAALALPFPIDG